MTFRFDLAATLMLLGALQALFLAVALLDRRKRRSFANRVLAALMALVAVRLVNAALFFASPETAGDAFSLAWTLPLIMSFSPLLFLYVRALTTPDFRPRAAHLAHFLPVLAVAALLVPFYRSPGSARAAPASASDGGSLLAGLPDALWLLQTVVYLVLILRIRREHLRRAPRVLAALQQVRLDWVRNMAAGYAGLCALVALYLVHLAWAFPFPESPAAVLNLAIAAVVLAWGYLGFRQPEIFAPGRAAGADAVPTGARTEKPAAAEPPDRTDEELRRVRAFMEARKPYRDPGLTLFDLARALDLPAYQLSAILNRGAGKTFFEFVNGYRVEAAKARLLQPDAGRLKMLALAGDCGFASKSAFNRVFKQATGSTPSDFRSSNKGDVHLNS